MNIKICKRCKREFISYKNVQKYCSKECCKQTFDKEYWKKYNELNRIKKSIIMKEYRKVNRIKLSNYQKEYVKNRLKIDINFKLKHYLRVRISQVLKGNPKIETTMKLVGCSLENLKKHLKSQFTSGMSFSNYGKWHIDHIKPCASFDLNKVSEQKKCFHYTNLQPLWALDNAIKGSRA